MSRMAGIPTGGESNENTLPSEISPAKDRIIPQVTSEKVEETKKEEEEEEMIDTWVDKDEPKVESESEANDNEEPSESKEDDEPLDQF